MTVSGLTEAELRCLNQLAAAWDAFLALPDKLEYDNQAFAAAIHTLQHLIAVRVARRVNPKVWRQPDKKEQNNGT